MLKRLINRLIFISSMILSEKARNIFLLSLVFVTTFAFSVFSYIHSSYFKTINLYVDLGFDKAVHWIIPLKSTDEEVAEMTETIMALPEVKDVTINATSVSDIEFTETGEYFVYQNYSFLGKQYPLDLIKGRLPKENNEAVISESARGSYNIGDQYCARLIREKNGAYEKIETKITIVGIVSKESYIMPSGYSYDSRSNLISFFETVSDEENSIYPLEPYLMVYGLKEVDGSFYNSLTAFVIPDDNYGQKDVVESISQLGIGGRFATYDDLKAGYDKYYSQIRSVAYITGVVVIILLLGTIFSGVVWGIEDNKHKLIICSVCGAYHKEIYALMVLSYLPTIFVGNITGYIVGIRSIRSMVDSGYRISCQYVIVFVVAEILLLIVVLLQYMLRRNEYFE